MIKSISHLYQLLPSPSFASLARECPDAALVFATSVFKLQEEEDNYFFPSPTSLVEDFPILN
jgi:hypothetical protein